MTIKTRVYGKRTKLELFLLRLITNIENLIFRRKKPEPVKWREIKVTTDLTKYDKHEEEQ